MIERDVDVPFFEVTIRALGGLLGAFTLGPNPKLLDLATQLGNALLPAFSSASGVPFCTVNLRRRNASCPASDFGESVPLSEMGSVQLEFSELGRLLGDDKFAKAADGAIEALRRTTRSRDGLYPSRIRPAHASPGSREVGFGSGSDSFYETLLKRWLQGGGDAPHLLRLYRSATTAGLDSLLRRSHPSGRLFVGRSRARCEARVG